MNGLDFQVKEVAWVQTETRLTVRYAETDQMGIVHHANYAVWFEAGRTDFIRQAGYSYSDIERQGVWLPLYELRCRFLSPARYEDEVVVTTRLKSFSRVRLIFAYEVYRPADGKLLATGETHHAWTTPDLKPVNLQKAMPELYQLLRQFTEEPL